jgi:hypothetical protein
MVLDRYERARYPADGRLSYQRFRGELPRNPSGLYERDAQASSLRSDPSALTKARHGGDAPWGKYPFVKPFSDLDVESMHP